MKKLLIIGISGLTGYKLAQLSINNFKVFGTFNRRAIKIKNCNIYQLDKTDKKKTAQLIKKINPNVIIDCSALHNVDYCETHQEETRKVNVDAPRYIAEICKKINAHMIYMSTDYVYDGKALQFTEESDTNPLNYYGLSKLMGEKEISNTGINYTIFRTSLIFGWNPHELSGISSSSGKSQNYVIWAINKLRNGENLNIVNDQYSTPTFVDNLAKALLKIAESETTGLFHIAGKNCLNRYDFTIKIAEIFDLNKELINSTTSDQFKQVAKRPMRCCLDVSKAEKILNLQFLNIEDALEKMKEQETANFNLG
ncbi:MAG: SDR family oxidoreductase [Candidatus Hermodarchaeota archaeon]